MDEVPYVPCYNYPIGFSTSYIQVIINSLCIFVFCFLLFQDPLESKFKIQKEAMSFMKVSERGKKCFNETIQSTGKITATKATFRVARALIVTLHNLTGQFLTTDVVKTFHQRQCSCTLQCMIHVHVLVSYF